ncbi:MAG: HlyD family efflux transporter periplasmic adaptor subunit [Treponema sp.]|nr:HlyD family efflux transporter periplasmic adaptor subunit [Treponema sp.]
MKIYDDIVSNYTQEYFLRKKPSSQNIVIFIITCFLITVTLILSFAPFEEVIKVKGNIRPNNNISKVSNAVTGRIKTISYESGQSVTKGQLLLEIDPTQLEAEKASLITQMEEENEKLDALYEIRQSILQDKNIINQNHYEAYLRFEVWKTNLSKLENIKNYNLEKLEKEKTLPSSMTTATVLNELNSQYLISCDDYNNLYISFEHDIEEEIIKYQTSQKINRTRLRQIEDSLLFTKVCAPIDGIIQEISVFNTGDWIQAGQNIFNIIPYETSSPKIEIIIPARQAGKIEEGMKVKIRFPSLPYHEFGGTEGTIITIDPDVTKTQNGEAFFIIRTNIEKTILSDKKGKSYPLKVGLEADARIVLSRKTILNYILEKLNLWY